MTDWTEPDSAAYQEISDVAVPRRAEMMQALVAVVPFERDESFAIVELGSGDGRLAVSLLEAFPRSTITALDGSEAMRECAAVRLARFGRRAVVRPFNLASLDWWDRMFGAGLVVSSLCLHHLNDAKKQYLYKAAADRITARGALLVADLVDPASDSLRRAAADQWDAAAEAQADAIRRPELFARFRDARWNHFRFPDPGDQPAALLHHLVWLRHAGFAAVDCFWMYAGHAVFGGFMQSVMGGRRRTETGEAPLSHRTAHNPRRGDPGCTARRPSICGICDGGATPSAPGGSGDASPVECSRPFIAGCQPAASAARPPAGS